MLLAVNLSFRVATQKRRRHHSVLVEEITVAIFRPCEIIIKIMVTLACLLLKGDISKGSRKARATPRLISFRG